MLLNNTHANSFRSNLQKGLPFWTASLLTGFLAIVYTQLFSIAENAFHSLRTWNPVSIFILTPLSFTAAYLLVKFFAPYAKGSGIPQVMASLDVVTRKNSWLVDELLGIKVILAKIFSSLLMVQGGGAIGREGPTIQIASSVFRIVERYVPTTWPKLSSQSYIITGAAAGLAAAFNTPLGGIVFAIEELAKIHIRFFRTPLFVAVIIAGLTAQGILGSYLYLGYPSVGNPPFLIFLPAIIVALISGLAGAFMCRIILWVRAFKRNFSISRNVVFTLLAGLLVACLGYFVNDSIFGTGKELMNGVLFSENKRVGLDTVLFRMLGPIICFNTGAAGGVFAPSLAAGAGVGGFVSALFDYTGADANVLILCGMVAFLTGVTRTPFTSAILVLEMTDRHGIIFHLMLAALVANVAALLVQRHSLYEILKKEYTTNRET
jgi:H+/Cl- antiporter ClcA